MKKVLLDMYLKKNLGDDLFLKIISERYNNTKFYIQPLCDYDKKKLNLKNIIYIRNIITRCINVILKKLKFKKINLRNILKKRMDVFVTLGGSMFIEQPNISELQLMQLIENKYNVVNKPFYVIGSNFGPYKNNYFIDNYKQIFEKAEDVCFREKNSFELFKDNKKVRYASDIAFSLDKNKYIQKECKKVVISVIDLKNRKNLQQYKEAYESKILDIINCFQKQKYEIVLMSFCKFEGDENEINSIINKCDNKENINVYCYNGNIDEALKIISSSEYVIATRFHAMILGILFNKKILPIIYSDKMINSLKDLKYDGKYLDIRNLDNSDISYIISNISRFVYNEETVKKDAISQFKKLDEFLK